MTVSFRYDDVEQALNEKKDIENIYIIENYKIKKSELIVGDCQIFIELDLENGRRQTKTTDSPSIE
ncbi:MAG: hypothetical protein E6R13_10240 [Spirochaetes bacterium]|nr:MAG: hypothetical protein E6R13_10240 [Spirochaetota bacterium]